MSAASDDGLVLSEDRTSVVSYTSSPDVPAVEVPDTVASLPEGLFAGCRFLKKVKLPRDVSVLPCRLFADCISLVSISLPTCVNLYGKELFSGCSSLKEIPFRAGLQEIPEHAFSGCTSVVSLVIPDSVKIIRRGAASGCSSLETVVLPASLEVLEKDAFAGCVSLHHIRISEDNTSFRVDESNGCLYERQNDGVELIVLSPVESEHVTAGLVKTEKAEVHRNTEKRERVHMQTAKQKDKNDIVERAAEIMAADTRPDDDGAGQVSDAEIRMLSAESDILSQNTLVDGNPVVLTQDEVDRVEARGEVMTTYDDSYFGAPVKRPGCDHDDGDDTDADGQRSAEDPMIGRIAAAAEKYECVTLSTGKNVPAWCGSLYVFAENLVFDSDGDGHFSDALVSCCRRIARIHHFTHIYMYYGLPLENEEFLQFFSEFIAARSTIYACGSVNTSKLSPSARRFADIAGISLEKDMLELENKLAGDPDANVLKMIIQDDYSE